MNTSKTVRSRAEAIEHYRRRSKELHLAILARPAGDDTLRAWLARRAVDRAMAAELHDPAPQP